MPILPLCPRSNWHIPKLTEPGGDLRAARLSIVEALARAIEELDEVGQKFPSGGNLLSKSIYSDVQTKIVRCKQAIVTLQKTLNPNKNPSIDPHDVGCKFDSLINEISNIRELIASPPTPDTIPKRIAAFGDCLVEMVADIGKTLLDIMAYIGKALLAVSLLLPRENPWFFSSPEYYPVSTDSHASFFKYDKNPGQQTTLGLNKSDSCRGVESDSGIVIANSKARLDGLLIALREYRKPANKSAQDKLRSFATHLSSSKDGGEISDVHYININEMFIWGGWSAVENYVTIGNDKKGNINIAGGLFKFFEKLIGEIPHGDGWEMDSSKIFFNEINDYGKPIARKLGIGRDVINSRFGKICNKFFVPDAIRVNICGHGHTVINSGPFDFKGTKVLV